MTPSQQATERQSDPRSNLLALAEHENPYLFLSCVGHYLLTVPQDDPVRAQTLKLLVKIGLFSVAEEFARACPETSPIYGQLQDVANQFGARRTDRIDWSQTDGRFTANLRALRGRGEQGASLAGQLEHAWLHEMPPGITLLRANDGNWQVRCQRSDGYWIWLPALQDFAGTTEAIDNEGSFRGQFVSPFLLNGVGTGCLVPRLWKATLHSYLTYSAAIYLVEPNLRALALALRLHDWSHALADERLILHVGVSAWEDWLRHMEAEPELPMPNQIVPLSRWPGDCTYPADEYRERVKQLRHAKDQQERQRAEDIYAGRDAKWWAQRYASVGAHDPIRVVCMTSRHTTFLQHSTRDLMAALERAGLPAQLIIEQRNHTALAASVLMRQFAEFQPDLVVIIDHHRQEMPERFVQDVPFICWIQDELPKLYSRDAGRSLGPLDFTMGFGRDTCVSQFGYPAERFMPCQIVVDPAKFESDPGQPSVDPDLQCDVAYIGHHAETPEALHDRVRKQAEPPATQLIDAFYEEMLPRMRSQHFNGAYDLSQMLMEVEIRSGIRFSDPEMRSRLLALYVRPLADRVMRHVTLEWVANWAEATGHTLRLYGHGWEQHPRFGRFAQGEARHGAHLGAIMRSAAINLHFGMNSALHQRVLETSAAGAFLLIRHHPHDFYPWWTNLLWDYLDQNKITKPTRIPMNDLPPEFIAANAQARKLIGLPPLEFVDVSEAFLQSRCNHEPDVRKRRYAGEMFPDLSRITFDSADSFAAQAEKYLADSEAREEIKQHMRETVLREFTYDALVGLMLGFIARQLHQQAELS